MGCLCHTLDDVFYLDRAPVLFIGELESIEARDRMRLYRCPVCGTCWAVDEWEKYSWQVASRVRDCRNWTGDGRIRERKELLLQERGGTGKVECEWSNCQELRVRGSAFCLNHLWRTGARR